MLRSYPNPICWGKVFPVILFSSPSKVHLFYVILFKEIWSPEFLLGETELRDVGLGDPTIVVLSRSTIRVTPRDATGVRVLLKHPGMSRGSDLNVEVQALTGSDPNTKVPRPTGEGEFGFTFVGP